MTAARSAANVLDVAGRAGVPPATAACALEGYGRMTAQRQARALAAADEPALLVDEVVPAREAVRHLTRLVTAASTS